MSYLTFVYVGSSRDMRKLIITLLKSGLADSIKRINYVQNYLLKGGKNIQKTEEKILLIEAQDENKLTEFLLKNFSQMKRIKLN